jgi:hypothetical protein
VFGLAACFALFVIGDLIAIPVGYLFGREGAPHAPGR